MQARPSGTRWLDDAPAAALVADASPKEMYDPLPVYSVKDYGAVGDNATDCTAAVAKAVNIALAAGSAAGSAGVVIYFPAGVYRFAAAPEAIAFIEIWTTSATARFIVAGEGEANTTLSFDPTVSQLLYFSSPDQNQPLQFTLENLSIETLSGIATNQPQNPVLVGLSTNSFIQHVSFVGTTNTSAQALVSADDSTSLTLSFITVLVEAVSFAPTGFILSNITNLAVDHILIESPASLIYAFDIVDAHQVTFTNIKINATVGGGDPKHDDLVSGIYLANVTEVSLTDVTLANPGDAHAYIPSFGVGVVIDDASDQITIERLTAVNLATAIFVHSNPALVPWSWEEKRITIADSQLLDCTTAGLLVNDNSTITVTDTTFGRSNPSGQVQWPSGSGIATMVDRTNLNVSNPGLRVSVTGSTFTSQGAGGIMADCGYFDVQDTVFHDTNVALSYQFWKLPTNPPEQPVLTFVGNTFRDVSQYVLFVDLVNSWQLANNTCTLTGPVIGTLNSNMNCYGPKEDCATANNPGCLFNAMP